MEEGVVLGNSVGIFFPNNTHFPLKYFSAVTLEQKRLNTHSCRQRKEEINLLNIIWLCLFACINISFFFFLSWVHIFTVVHFKKSNSLDIVNTGVSIASGDTFC
jgi:hypothetical protein